MLSISHVAFEKLLTVYTVFTSSMLLVFHFAHNPNCAAKMKSTILYLTSRGHQCLWKKKLLNFFFFLISIQCFLLIQNTFSSIEKVTNIFAMYSDVSCQREGAMSGCFSWKACAWTQKHYSYIQLQTVALPDLHWVWLLWVLDLAYSALFDPSLISGFQSDSPYKYSYTDTYTVAPGISWHFCLKVITLENKK